MSGARCVATLLSEMKRRGRDSRFGVISMCIGMYLSHFGVEWKFKHLTFGRPQKLGQLTDFELQSMVYAGSGMGAAAVLERGDSVDELRNARPTSH